MSGSAAAELEQQNLATKMRLIADILQGDVAPEPQSSQFASVAWLRSVGPWVYYYVIICKVLGTPMHNDAQ